MKGTSRFVTILLAVLSVVCISVSILFLRNEKNLSAERQKTVAKLSAELEPLNEERSEWKKQDEEWQKSLVEKKKGKTCILLCFDTLDEDLYDTMFNRMDEYGFKGTFSLKNGVLPGSQEDVIDSEEFWEMLDCGWDYAISIEESIVSDEEIEAAESEVAEIDEIEELDESTDIEKSIIAGTEWLEQIDSYRQRLEETDIAVPEILFCSSEQYASVTEEELTKRGFQMIHIQNIGDFPEISQEDENGLLKIESGLYTQRFDLENRIEQAIQNGESLAIDVNKVVRISKDPDYDLTLGKFDSLISQLKNYEEQEMLYVFTLSEYYEYVQKEKKEYKNMLAEYAAFRTEMNERIEKLDRKEKKLVEKAKKAVEDN